MKINWTSPLLGVCVTTALLASAPAAAQKTTELTFSAWIPASHILVANFMVPWAKEVEQATEGRVKIRFLPKPVANPPGHYDAVRNGAVDFAFISNSYYPGRFDLLKFSMLPFSGNSALATSVASWRIYDKYLKDVNLFRGVKLLGIYGHGPGAVFTTDRKVEKIEDFDGLKVRIGGGMQADVAKVLNVNAVVKPAPQSYELMSTGVVDGVFFPPESIDSFRLVDIVKNATIFPGGLYADTHGIIMNEQAFDKLPKQDQAIILKLSGEHIARMGGKAWGDADDKAMQAMKAQKVNIIMASDKLVADIKQRTASFEKAWLEEAKAKGIDGPMVLQAYRDELKRVEAGQ